MVLVIRRKRRKNSRVLHNLQKIFFIQIFSMLTDFWWISGIRETLSNTNNHEIYQAKKSNAVSGLIRAQKNVHCLQALKNTTNSYLTPAPSISKPTSSTPIFPVSLSKFKSSNSSAFASSSKKEQEFRKLLSSETSLFEKVCSFFIELCWSKLSWPNYFYLLLLITLITG